jgi:ribonuclease-3
LKFPFFQKKRNSEDLELIRFILTRFGYHPTNLAHFEQALTHRSLSNSDSDVSNERLEFLGDAILDAVIADYLFQRFPSEDEGYLTKIKSKVVSRKTLGEIGELMELRSVIRYHKGRTINLATIEGNAFEAIMGAIYLDGGYVAVKKSIEHHVFRRYVDLNLEFDVVSEENIEGNWRYTIVARINETKYGRGIGTTKKMAEQAAAKETLELMGEI